MVINRPDQPLDFLIQKLSKPERKFKSRYKMLMIYELSYNFQMNLKLLLFFKMKASSNTFIAKRVFVMGPPGSSRKENALAFAEYFNW